MCGIVGLFLKDKSLEPELGKHLAAMLAIMSDRGPDSAGFAIYSAPDKGVVKLTLRGPAHYDWQALGAILTSKIDQQLPLRPVGTHAVLKVEQGQEAKAREVLRETAPDIAVVGSGLSMEIYKEVGRPADVARQFDLARVAGTHGIGHTRMATESAVTTRGAHPFSTGRDQCLVHNGSLSNHNSVRRHLIHDGFTFETDNDSEVAAGFLTAQMGRGRNLGQALEASLTGLDGFYTFVVGTASGFGVLRDAIACKPAVMAETDRYVGFGSEYRALAMLPGIETARVWEPEPKQVYFWERAQ